MIVSSSMHQRYNQTIGIYPSDCEDLNGMYFGTPAVEIDESLFTHFDQGDG